MIQLKNVVKHFGKGSTLVKALNGVSFDLPDSGFVFIVGKSGSGKSTLMSVLGGLLDTTKGSVYVDDVDITKLKNSELDKYRNNYIGVIYQSFNLFDNETVYSNILSSLEISENKLSNDEIDKILRMLDLENKKNALARELSGGQKQRAAIARALVKNPEVILADEPTGNLDSKTAKSILDILQEISKTKLVVIISHDIANARKYADRIITLADGLVVSDQIRNQNYVDDGKNVVVSDETNDKVINELNKQLDGKAILSKEDERFIDFNGKVTTTHKKADFGKIKHSLRIPFKLSGGFLKSTLPSFIFTLIISTLMVGLLSMAHNFTQFDGQGAVNDLCERYETNNLILTKGYSLSKKVSEINKDNLIAPKEHEHETIINGYSGNSYKFYNIPIFNGVKNLDQEKPYQKEDYSSFYSFGCEGLGVVDKDYLNKIYPDYKVLAGSVDLTKTNSNIIVTDYFADSLIVVSNTAKAWCSSLTSSDPNDPYQKIMSQIINYRYRIGAVISTGYKERYGSILKMMETISKDPTHASEYYNKLYASDIYMKFINECQTKLNVAYSINQDFYEKYLDDYSQSNGNYAILRNTTFYDLNGNVITSYTGDQVKGYDHGVENSFFVSFNIFNKWFGTNITSVESEDYQIKPMQVDILGFDQTLTDQPEVSKVINLVPSPLITDNNLYASPDVIKLFKRTTIHCCGFIFDNQDGFHTVYSNSRRMYYHTTSTIYTPVFQVIDIVNVFSDIFILVAGVLIGIAFIVVVFHNLRVIKTNKYRIGVYKSLGYTNSKIAAGVILNGIYLFIGIFAVSLVSTYFLSGVVNVLLGKSFSQFMGSEIFSQLSLIYFNVWQLLIYMGVILGVTVISLLLPIERIRNTKPNEIIVKAD